ncbi:unnamed protein product [Phytophthora fragariaefolia]|uniref:Unnamed protein product n=1 Tax=Phytophthora fragariaefolia TaxID=1490495 RepID=A0A9W6UB10_9STRA|nr:unnamed protein product [Phytophthora fragariaefolia]
MMREQQQFMAQSAELQRQIAAALQQQQQQHPIPAPQPETREFRAEGISMPKFGGKKDEDQRPLSLLVASLQGPAAAWYREYVSHDGNVVHSVAHLGELLSNEFTAPDRQHLRDQLLRLKQSNIPCLEDSVSTFRGIICKVEDISDIDKVMYFQKGLVTEIQQEVKLRQFRSTTEVVSFALRYERTHRVSRGQGRNQTPTSSTAVDGPTPMEIGNSRMISREECMRRNLCLDCKELGHRLAQCHCLASVPARACIFRSTQSLREQHVESSLRTVSADEFQIKLQTDGYLEVYNVNLKTAPEKKSTPPQLRPVIAEFADVFPSEPLPPSRSIEPEVILKPGAKPSNRAPFRLSKVEQEALDIFVADLLIKTGLRCPTLRGSVDFLGHTISAEGLYVDSRKTHAIAAWPEPSTVKELQRFLGLAGYYRRFIHLFAALVLPLSQLTKKDVDWVWSDAQRQAFNAIKLALQHAPVLQLPDFDKPFVFTLHHRPGVQNVVADALSRPPEPLNKSGVSNGDDDMELNNVSVCLDDMTCATCTTMVRTGKPHALMPTSLLTIPLRDQELMLDVKVPADTSHRSGAEQVRMKLYATAVADATTISSLQLSPKTRKRFQKAYAKDPVLEGMWRTKRADSNYELFQGLIYLKSDNNVRRLCVPTQRQLRLDTMHNVHDAAIMAHPGVRRTQLAAAQWYFWPGMDAEIKDYVQSCESCMRYKSSTGRKSGKLQPVPLPTACWDVVSTDFITHLPVSDGFDAIIVVVDKLFKRPVYIPMHTTATAEDTAKLFFNNLDEDQNGYDNGHRAQADGQTERQNRTLEDSLRCSISYRGNDWNEHLPLIEYAHATLVSSSSKLSPFFVDTGRHPKSPLQFSDHAQPTEVSRVEYASRFVQHRQEVIERARQNLLKAQAAQKKFYDKRRADNPFKVGDLALLPTQDLNMSHATAETTLRSRKFIPRFIGPYTILELRGNVALLDLPANLKHRGPRFNIDKLKVYTSNPDRFTGRVIPKSTPVVFDQDGEPLHIVEALIQKRIFNRQPEYLVKWHGLPHHKNTWERDRDIKHVSHWNDLIKDLRQRNSKARA